MLGQGVSDAAGIQEPQDSMNLIVLPGLVENSMRATSDDGVNDDEDEVPGTSEDEETVAARRERKKSEKKKKRMRTKQGAKSPQSPSTSSSVWDSQKLKDVSVRLRPLEEADLKKWLCEVPKNLEMKKSSATATATATHATSLKTVQGGDEERSSAKKRLTGKQASSTRPLTWNLRSRKRQAPNDKGSRRKQQDTDLVSKHTPHSTRSKNSAQSEGDDEDDVPVVNVYGANDIHLDLAGSDETSSEETEVSFSLISRRSRKTGNYSGKKRSRKEKGVDSAAEDEEEEEEVFATCPNTQKELEESFATCRDSVEGE